MRAKCATKEMASGVRMESYSRGMRPVMATPRRWLGAILTGFLQRMPVIMRPLGVHASSVGDLVLLGLMMVVS